MRTRKTCETLTYLRECYWYTPTYRTWTIHARQWRHPEFLYVVHLKREDMSTKSIDFCRSVGVFQHNKGTWSCFASSTRSIVFIHLLQQVSGALIGIGTCVFVQWVTTNTDPSPTDTVSILREDELQTGWWCMRARFTHTFELWTSCCSFVGFCSSYLLLFARAERSHFLKKEKGKSHEVTYILERRDEIKTTNGKIYPSLNCVLAVYR